MAACKCTRYFLLGRRPQPDTTSMLAEAVYVSLEILRTSVPRHDGRYGSRKMPREKTPTTLSDGWPIGKQVKNLQHANHFPRRILYHQRTDSFSANPRLGIRKTLIWPN